MLVPFKPDTDNATKSLNAWRGEIEKTFGLKLPLNLDDKAALEGLGRIKAGVGLVTSALDAGAGVLQKYPGLFGSTGQEAEKVVGHLKDAASTTLSWATTGATVGSIFPGIGTAVGGIVGGLGGAASATYDWLTGTEEVKQSQAEILKIRKEQAEEDRKFLDQLAKVRQQWKETADATDFSKQAAKGLSEGIKKIADDSERVEKAWGGTAKHVQTTQEKLDALNKSALEFLQKDIGNKGSTDRLDQINRELDRITNGQAISRGITDPARGVGVRGRSDPLPKEEVAAQDKELYDAKIEAYRDYVGNITSITGELTKTLEQNIAAQENIFEGFGAAAERGVSRVLKALGREWSVKALGEVAEGIAALANPAAAALKGETAAGHFLAAAKYGVAAVAAGVGGAVLGGDATRRDNAREEAKREESGAGGSLGASSSRISDPGPQQLAPAVFYLGGGPNSTTIYAGDSEREEQNARDKLNRILGSGRR